MSDGVTLSKATWSWPAERSSVIEWTKSEVKRLVLMMTGRSARVDGDGSQGAADTDGPIIVIGLAALEQVGTRMPGFQAHIAPIRSQIAGLGKEEYFLKTLIEVSAEPDAVTSAAPVGRPVVNRGGNGTVILLAGGSDQALAWACFELFEQLGCRFTISGDIIPERTDPSLPTFDLKRSSAHRIRGIWFSYCFATNSIMSISDYEALFGQMVKLKLNRFLTYHFENEPFVDFSYRGERKLVGDVSHPTSAYISYGRQFSGSYLTKDVPIGGELFGRERVAPLELQHVRSSDQALTEGVRFMRTVYRTARRYGIDPWISVLPAFVPMNFTKYTRRMPRPHLHWSALVSFTDPILDEVNRNRFEAILRDYPEIAGINLGIPEGYYEDPYPASVAIIERERPRYREALELHKRYWGRYWNNDEKLLDAHIDRDIGFVEILKRSLDIVREVAPGLPIGVMTICKAYLLTLLHEELPRDVSFVDIESRSLWTMDGAPLHLFDRMTGRDCAVIPRAVDDGSMAGLQCNLELYRLDGFLHSPEKHGTAGLVIQTTHVRGNEHNVSYLARGMWEPDLTPAEFYRDYAERIAGAEPGVHLERAFAVLETNEQELGGRGQGNLPWNKTPMQIEVLRHFRDFSQPLFGVPYDRGFVDSCSAKSQYFRKALGRLEEADRHFQKAAEAIGKAGSGAASYAVREIAYLTAKNAGYRSHLAGLVELGTVYEKLYHAFEAAGSGARRMILEEAIAHAEAASSLAEASAHHFARAVDHPTDLGVLWAINTSTVIGCRLLRIYVANLLRFYRGEEYWEPVRWETLFGDCPYPAYGLDEMKLSQAAPNREYEPG